MVRSYCKLLALHISTGYDVTVVASWKRMVVPGSQPYIVLTTFVYVVYVLKVKYSIHGVVKVYSHCELGNLAVNQCQSLVCIWTVSQSTRQHAQCICGLYWSAYNATCAIISSSLRYSNYLKMCTGVHSIFDENN